MMRPLFKNRNTETELIWYKKNSILDLSSRNISVEYVCRVSSEAQGREHEYTAPGENSGG